MAAETYVHGLGTCKTCGNPLMSAANGDTGGQVLDCIYCAAKKPVDKPGSSVSDPGEEEMRKVLALSGVHHPVIAGEQKTAPKVRTVTQTVTQEVTSLEQIITALEALPMPKSMKQFKSINKAITTLKKALAEN